MAKRQMNLKSFLKRNESSASTASSSLQQPAEDSDISENAGGSSNLEDPDILAVKKPKTVRKLTNLNSWKQEFDWLDFEENKKLLFCKICIDSKSSKKSNTFVSGSSNYQRSALVRHAMSDDHMVAKKILTQRRYMGAAKQIVHGKYEGVLMAQLRTATYMAKNNIADRKYASLIDLQLANGATSFKDNKGLYTSDHAAAEMQICLADVCREEIRVMIQETPYLGIMVDESLDIAVNKKLVIFCKIIHSGTVKVIFCANVEVLDGKAETIYNAITNFLQDMGVPVRNVSGLGTDGASVMMGRLNGVGVKMRADNPKIVHIWCSAHRLSLVAHWASKTIPFLNKVQETMVAIYNFYCYSAVRYNKIRELTRIMNVQVKKFKKPTQVRWLSVYEAVEAIHGSLSVLYLSLDHEATSNTGDGSAKAKGLKKTIQSYKFIATLCLLKDILHSITILSKAFQADIIDIETMTSMLTSTRQQLSSFVDINPMSVSQFQDTLNGQNNNQLEYQGIPVTNYNDVQKNSFDTLKISFIRNLETEFSKRFSDSDMIVLKDLNILFNPKLLPQNVQEMHQYGLESLDRTIAFFGDNHNHVIIHEHDMRQTYNQFKFVQGNNRDSTLHEFSLMLVNNGYDQLFPSYCELARILLTIPITSVPCERGFSVQNQIITPRRNKLGIKNLENKALIQTSLLDVETLCQRAHVKFLSTNRSKFN